MQFDQRQPESMGVVTSGQNTEQISTITGATTQDRQRTGASIQRADDVPLHRPQSPGQIRIWIVVTVVPGVVVANEAHSANLPGVPTTNPVYNTDGCSSFSAGFSSSPASATFGGAFAATGQSLTERIQTMGQGESGSRQFRGGGERDKNR